MTRIPEGFGAALVREGLREASAGPIAAIAADRIRWPAGGGVPVVLGLDGQPREGATVAELLRELRAAYPEAFAGGPADTPIPVPTTLTDRARAEHQASQAQQNNASDDWPNPWAASSLNLTRQALLTKNNPARAAELRASAGR